MRIILFIVISSMISMGAKVQIEMASSEEKENFDPKSHFKLSAEIQHARIKGALEFPVIPAPNFFA